MTYQDRVSAAVVRLALAQPTITAMFNKRTNNASCQSDLTVVAAPGVFQVVALAQPLNVLEKVAEAVAL